MLPPLKGMEVLCMRKDVAIDEAEEIQRFAVFSRGAARFPAATGCAATMFSRVKLAVRF